MRIAFSLALTAVLVGAAPALAEAVPEPCHIGVYRLGDGALVDVAPSDKGLRWRMEDGRTGKLASGEPGAWRSTGGWSSQADGVTVAFGACDEGRIAFAGRPGSRIALAPVETTFVGHGGTRLAGRLVLPPGDGSVPIAVMVHGSESDSALTFRFEQRMWPALGVGVFVYDKRGTGGSEGQYTQNFHMLSDEAAAAVAEARRLAGPRAGRVGLDGASQGGWIAPLAATKTPVDFVVVRFGMAESPLAEDRGETIRGLADKGYGPEVLEKAAEVAEATGRIVASGFKTGFEELNALKAKYSAEPWFKDLKGEYTGQIANAPEAAVRVIGPRMDRGTTWDFEPMPVLARVQPPMLWVLAGEDLEAPVEETRRRLLSLAADGRPVTVLEFPDTDHGIREFEVVGGERRYTRYSDGFYRAVLDFTRDGRLQGDYGAGRKLAP